MRQLFSGKIITVCFFIFTILMGGPKEAFCEFDVIWGVSDDDGLTGHKQLGQWLVDNSYFNDFDDADFFAKTGYTGFNSGDQDPFYWNLTQTQSFSVQIVQEVAGFSDFNTLGYYTGSGDTKSLTQIFSGTEEDSRTLMVNQPFGLYLGTPEQNTWYTDNNENDQQNGILRSLKREGGHPQGLIYELKKNEEWLVAWEDLDATKLSVDRDYNDMYVKLTSTTVAPEPVSSTLFLLGGGALTAARMKRARKKRIQS